MRIKISKVQHLGARRLGLGCFRDLFWYPFPINFSIYFEKDEKRSDSVIPDVFESPWFGSIKV